MSNADISQATIIAFDPIMYAAQRKIHITDWEQKVKDRIVQGYA
jgi:hypothetical protein